MTGSLNESSKYSKSDAPASRLRAVTPNDDADLPEGPCKALWINDDGVVAVNVVGERDTDAVLMTITGPGVLPVRAKRVKDTSTTANDIVALYS